MPAPAGAEIAWEIVERLQRRRRDDQSLWRRTLEARDEALRALRGRLDASEAETARLRDAVEEADGRIAAETLDARRKIAEALRALETAEARRASERRLYEEALKDLRGRLAAETARGRDEEQDRRTRERVLLIFNNLLTRLKRA